MFLYTVLTPKSTTSGLWSAGNTRKYQQIDVYIYQCVLNVLYNAMEPKFVLKLEKTHTLFINYK